MYLVKFINVRSENAFARKTFVGCSLLALKSRPIIQADTTSVITLQVCKSCKFLLAYLVYLVIRYEDASNVVLFV